MEFHTFSQLEQDITVYNFYNCERGYFIDIGANDGISLSNTKGLEGQGWTGICAEPVQHIYNKLNSCRACHCENTAVYSVSGKTVNIIVQTDNLGLLSGIDKHISDSYNKSIQNRHDESITTMTLTDLLDKYNAPTFIHYASIDTEGSEIEVLKGMNFDKYTVGYISIEHNNITENRDAIHDIFVSNGFIYHKNNQWDDDYIHRSLIEGSYGAFTIKLGQTVVQYARSIPCDIIYKQKKLVLKLDTKDLTIGDIQWSYNMITRGDKKYNKV